MNGRNYGEQVTAVSAFKRRRSMSTENLPSKKAKDRDGLYKRRKMWHYDYKDPDTGQWKSKSTGSKLYNEAKEVKKAFLKSLEGSYKPGNDRLRFSEAAASYLQHRKVSVSPGTVQLEKERLRAIQKLLSKFTSKDLKLKDMDIKLFRTYQQRRIAEGVGARTVNMECQVLRSILKHHDQWKLDQKYEQLPEPPSQVGRVLTPEEEIRLLETARSNPDWSVAYHATVIENETGLRGVELRNLQLSQIDLMGGEIHIQKSKTHGGIRSIPLSPDALESLKNLLARAEALGAYRLDHFLLPARELLQQESGTRRRHYNPNNPTRGWRTAWRKLTTQAGLKGLRGHDLRHNWITAHAEIGTPQSVLEAQAGHLSKRMSDHYKHVSDRAAHKATQELTEARKKLRAEAQVRLNAVSTDSVSTSNRLRH